MKRWRVFSMSFTPPSSWVIYLQEMITTSFYLFCLIWTYSSSHFQAAFDLFLHNIFFLFSFFLIFDLFSLHVSSLFYVFFTTPVPLSSFKRHPFYSFQRAGGCKTICGFEYGFSKLDHRGFFLIFPLIY